MRRKNKDLCANDLEIPPIVEFEDDGAVADAERGGEVVVGVDEEEVGGGLVAPLEAGVEVHVAGLLVVLDIGG